LLAEQFGGIREVESERGVFEGASRQGGRRRGAGDDACERLQYYRGGVDDGTDELRVRGGGASALQPGVGDDKYRFDRDNDRADEFDSEADREKYTSLRTAAQEPREYGSISEDGDGGELVELCKQALSTKHETN